MWLSNFSILIPTGLCIFRVNMPGRSLFQNPCAKTGEMQKKDRLRFIAYLLFVYFKSSLKYVDFHFSVVMGVQKNSYGTIRLHSKHENVGCHDAEIQCAVWQNIYTHLTEKIHHIHCKSWILSSAGTYLCLQAFQWLNEFTTMPDVI